MEKNIMAAFIKRILKSTQKEHQKGWASREEQKQFERQREEWRSNMSTLMIR